MVHLWDNTDVVYMIL